MTSLSMSSLDHLVELHVLAEQGDEAAAATAARLTAANDEARRVWDTVEAECRQVRRTPTGRDAGV